MLTIPTTCKITGVIKDIPPQSHFHFSFIRPIHDTYHDDQDDWLSNNYASYVLVRPGVTQAALQEKVNATIDNYLAKQLEQVLHTNASDMKKGGNHFIYPVMALTDIHLHSNKSYEFEANGNIAYVYIFSVIAIFILLIACVNFMNLSTARSANRAKEVGIRKVAGSLRSNLITQFLTESVLMSFLSLLIALGIAALLLPLVQPACRKTNECVHLIFNLASSTDACVDHCRGLHCRQLSCILSFLLSTVAGAERKYCKRFQEQLA